MIVVMGVTGCASTFRPLGRLFDDMPQDASPDYKQGWTEGCETGLSHMTNAYYQTFYKFKVTESKIKIPDYYLAWKDASAYCRHYAYSVLRESDMRTTLPNASGDIFNKAIPNPTNAASLNTLPTGHGLASW